MEEEEEGGFEEPTAPAWMATFGDMMSLLLCFFVLLMSFASMDVRKYAAVAGSMRDAFGVQRVHEGQLEALATSLVRLSNVESTPFLRVIDRPARLKEREQQRKARIEAELREMKLQRVVQVETSPDGIVVRLPGEMLFSPAAAELRPEAIVLLREVADLIRAIPGKVAVRGHTDASPVASGEHASNWSLSSARAVAALVHLVDVERIEPKRLRATGFGATQPIAGASDQEQRRVEFVFLRDEFSTSLNDDNETLRDAADPSAPSKMNEEPNR